MHVIVDFALKNRLIVLIFTVILVIVGIRSAISLPIDAVPDVTPNQVLVLTQSPSLSPLEVERFLTFPVEISMSGLPGIENIYSISRYGVSYVAIYFKEDMDLYFCRQLVLERLGRAREMIPSDYGTPEMGPVSTGLGEIYHFKLTGTKQSAMELRSLLDWTLTPALRSVPGIVDVNVHGGDLKTYEVQVDNNKLLAYRIPMTRVLDALRNNNSNEGGAYIVNGQQQSLIRGEGLINDISEVGSIVIGHSATGTPIYVSNVANVVFAPMVKQGFATQDGNGEMVLGVSMMLMGENSRVAVDRVKEKLIEIQKDLPQGVKIEPFYDRTELVRKTIKTVSSNLTEGAILVMVVLFIMLGNIAGSIMVSLIIPLSMLTAFIFMNFMGVSGNLMSLGAIDFGLIVDGSVFMIEAILRKLGHRKDNESPMSLISAAGREVSRPIVFGVLIIILVYVPILTLTAAEGKMLKPMAITVMLALSASLVFALTIVPVLASYAFRKGAKEKQTWLLRMLEKIYKPVLRLALGSPLKVVVIALALLGVSLAVTPFLGSVFLPKLDEGSLLVMIVRQPGISIDESRRQNAQIESALKSFPQVTTVVSRTGRPEVALDPAGMEMTDTYVMMKPEEEWPKDLTKTALIEKMRNKLTQISPGADFTFSQPIEMRMQELLGAGLRSDIGVKIYGDDLNILHQKGEQIGGILKTIQGASDVRVEHVLGLPYLRVRVKRNEIARYGINADDVLSTVSAIGGNQVGQIVEGERRFALQVRLAPRDRANLQALRNLKIADGQGRFIPLSQIADVIEEDGPNQISREQIRRRLTAETNVVGRDLGSFVAEAQKQIDAKVKLPQGYRIEWSGQFKQLQGAVARLSIAVPITLLAIFLMLYFNSNSLKVAGLIYTNIPLAATGGILALLARQMPFSVSAGVGFIALFGIAVLNGVVLINYITQLRQSGEPLESAVYDGSITQLRPVAMTALVATLGFLPMAVSHGAGAEVQQPLATVVIGGMIPCTVLTLLLIPTLYLRLFRKEEKKRLEEQDQVEPVESRTV